jgi:two-component system, OmpR family, sensor kinase
MEAMFRSFYFRIGFSFVVFVVAVLLAQNAIFSYVLSRSGNPLPGRPPNNVAAIVSADIGSTLAEDPDVDLSAYLNREYSRVQPIYLVMRDGRIVANRPAPLAENLRRIVDSLLAGSNSDRMAAEPALRGTPVVMAPIQVGNQLRGMVVLPPAPSAAPLARDVGRLLSPPGTVVLIVITMIAAVFIFEPARRRLKALERATERLGAGDLAARAAEHGHDEIARVAAAFNRMAAELAARDEALRTSNRLRRQMLADVSHELKTPLTAMRGFVETLRMPDVTIGPATRERYFQTLERETLRLDRIVTDLLDLARLENGAAPLKVRLFAVRRVFEHVVARHDYEARSRRIAIGIHVADAVDQVTADPDRLEQVVENLVANALRHTPDGGCIELRANEAASGVELAIVDSGSGIAPEHLPHVFERFYKVDASRANGSGGSGLGLSIAKTIVERHGGDIRVASQPGRTVFTMRLPQKA